MEGRIVRLIKDKGFGFIRDEHGIEFFVHRTAVKNKRFEDLQVGDTVRFEGGTGAKGPRADDVYA